MGTSLGTGIVLTFGLLIALLILGQWVFAALITAGIIASLMLVGNADMLAYVPFNSANSWTLTTIPLFVLVGTLFLYGGVSDKIYRGAAAFTSRVPGGLLHANVLASAIFSALTGSSTGCTATIATIALPEMEKRGYDERLSLCSVAAGGTLGSLIPPSTIFIIYGAMTMTSIGKLFFAGLIPGILLTICFMVYQYFKVKSNPTLAPPTAKVSSRELLLGLRDLLPTAVAIGVILGGIYKGVFTPTEAAAIGCVIAIGLSIFYGEFSFRMLHRAAQSSLGVTCFIMLILVGSSILTNALAVLRIPHRMVALVQGMQLSPLSVLVMICVFYIILGCLMQGSAFLIMTLPVTFPLAMGVGYDPIHFGVIVCIVVQLGLITPPVALDLYVVQGIRKHGTLADLFGPILPFCSTMILLLIIVIVFPSLSTWLPSAMIGK